MTNVRKKARVLHYHEVGTGGGPKKHKDLKALEERIVGLSAKVVIEGISVPEAGIDDDELEDSLEVFQPLGKENTEIFDNYEESVNYQKELL